MTCIIEYLPLDLVYHFTSLEFDRRHFIMFNTCCKTLLTKYKNDSHEIWEDVSNHIANIITNGYRNFRINNLEFFVVNARIGYHHDGTHIYCLHTQNGLVIRIYKNNININTFNINANHIQYLKEAYPYNPISRPLTIGKIRY